MINPYDVTQTADALHAALSLDDAERTRRSEALAAAAMSMPPSRWFADQLRKLDRIAVS
jgi:trehalose 6-phosphate synthase